MLTLASNGRTGQLAFSKNLACVTTSSYQAADGRTCVGVSTWPSSSISTDSYLTIKASAGFSSTSSRTSGPLHWLRSAGIFTELLAAAGRDGSKTLEASTHAP